LLTLIGLILHLFTTTFLTQYRFKLFFIIIWLHVSILDLFFITYKGPVFLWQENSEFITLAVHFLIALTTTGLYKLLFKVRANQSEKVSEQ